RSVSTHKQTVSTPLASTILNAFWDSHLVSTHRWTVSTPLEIPKHTQPNSGAVVYFEQDLFGRPSPDRTGWGCPETALGGPWNALSCHSVFESCLKTRGLKAGALASEWVKNGLYKALMGPRDQEARNSLHTFPPRSHAGMRIAALESGGLLGRHSH
ncbi:hypothetical protein Taro_031902, partial [Colocasia esculenta]|nr:hypothetical protein [Colocasia esculenta]